MGETQGVECREYFSKGDKVQPQNVEDLYFYAENTLQMLNMAVTIGFKPLWRNYDGIHKFFL